MISALLITLKFFQMLQSIDGLAPRQALERRSSKYRVVENPHSLRADRNFISFLEGMHSSSTLQNPLLFFWLVVIQKIEKAFHKLTNQFGAGYDVQNQHTTLLFFDDFELNTFFSLHYKKYLKATSDIIFPETIMSNILTKSKVGSKQNHAQSKCQNLQICLPSSKVEPEFPIGLINLGNTCFLNSIIQFLFSADILKNKLVDIYGNKVNTDTILLSKLIGKLFAYLEEKQTEKLKIRDILTKITKLLSSNNIRYSISRQEDALETLLIILKQILYHQDFTKFFSISSRIQCDCRISIINDMFLSKSSSVCHVCKKKIQRNILKAPEYIILSNSDKIMAERERVEIVQINSQLFEFIYRLKSQIIFFGSGSLGFFDTRRYEGDLSFILHDEKVELETIKNHVSKIPGLIMLYELKQKKKYYKESLNQATNKDKFSKPANKNITTNQKPIKQEEHMSGPTKSRKESSQKQENSRKVKLNQVYRFQIKMPNFFPTDTAEINVRLAKKQCFIKIYKKTNKYEYQILNKELFPYFYGKDQKFDYFYNKVSKEENQFQKVEAYIQSHLISCSISAFNASINKATNNSSKAKKQPRQLDSIVIYEVQKQPF